MLSVLMVNIKKRKIMSAYMFNKLTFDGEDGNPTYNYVFLNSSVKMDSMLKKKKLMLGRKEMKNLQSS